jgi:hypothetical protein
MCLLVLYELSYGFIFLFLCFLFKSRVPRTHNQEIAYFISEITEQISVKLGIGRHLRWKWLGKFNFGLYCSIISAA